MTVISSQIPLLRSQSGRLYLRLGEKGISQLCSLMICLSVRLPPTTAITKTNFTMTDAAAADADTLGGDNLKSGPFGLLYNAVRGNTQVLVNVRNNHKLLGRVKAYDRHMNL